MCDGESMFVESCPGGTVWDDLNNACVWPDMQTATAELDQQEGLFISFTFFSSKIIFHVQFQNNHHTDNNKYWFTYPTDLLCLPSKGKTTDLN
jgi:hypothetical protein